MAEGTSFRTVIPEEGVAKGKPEKVQILIFCSGKVYYDLVNERARLGYEEKVAIARIEQVGKSRFFIKKSKRETFFK